MNPFFSYPAGENLEDQPGNPNLTNNERPHSMNEGGEFLDDAIRMIDLPLIFNKQTIDAGHTWNLL